MQRRTFLSRLLGLAGIVGLGATVPASKATWPAAAGVARHDIARIKGILRYDGVRFRHLDGDCYEVIEWVEDVTCLSGTPVPTPEVPSGFRRVATNTTLSLSTDLSVAKFTRRSRDEQIRPQGV